MPESLKVKRKANHIDILIGKNAKLLRERAKYSQEKIGGAAGVTFKQIQKYESGANHMGVSTIYRLSKFYGACIEGWS